MTDRLADKRCLVTGASRGIGRAIAEAFEREGARVALVSRSLPELEAVAEEIGDDAVAVECDVRETDAVDAMVEEVVTRFGGLDVVVNNAGIIESGPLTSFEDADMERIVDVNLLGQLRVARAALPHLVTSEGSLINVSSQLGEVGIPDAAVYCSTKGGINNLTRQLATEYGEDGVRINALAPGVIETDMTTPALEEDPEWLERKLAKIPMNRLGQPEDIQGPAVFLASAESRYMTGHVLVVDGGYLAE